MRINSFRQSAIKGYILKQNVSSVYRFSDNMRDPQLYKDIGISKKQSENFIKIYILEIRGEKEKKISDRFPQK